MTDLRDQLADHNTAARDRLAAVIAPYATAERARHIADAILDAGWLPPRNTHRTRNKATCHPSRPVEARGLCKGCYGHAWSQGTLGQHPAVRHRVPLATFVDTYDRMRDEGATRRNIADRLGMTLDACTQAYYRAVRTGALTPDRRPV